MRQWKKCLKPLTLCMLHFLQMEIAAANQLKPASKDWPEQNTTNWQPILILQSFLIGPAAHRMLRSLTSRLLSTSHQSMMVEHTVIEPSCIAIVSVDSGYCSWFWSQTGSWEAIYMYTYMYMYVCTHTRARAHTHTRANASRGADRERHHGN